MKKINSAKKRKKVIFVLPHSYEPFFPKLKKDIRSIHSLDHFSTRYIDFMLRHSKKYDFELFAISSTVKKPIRILHDKGFYIQLFPRDFPSILPLETSYSMLKEIDRLSKRDKKEKNNYNKIIWHINSYYLIMSDPISFILHKNNANFALHHRGAGFSVKTLPYSIYKYWIMNPIIFRRAKLVIAENKDEQKKLTSFYHLNSSKVMYAPNPVEILSIEKDKYSLRNVLGLPRNKTIIIYAGRLMRGKGVVKLASSMIKTLRKEKSIYFVMLGGGESYDELVRMIKEEKIDNFKIIEWVVKEDLFKYYHAADIFVHPNMNIKFEGTPNALIECQGSGLPVIGFNIGGVRDIIKPGYNGDLEYSNNMDNLVGKAINLAKNKKLLEKMKKNSIINYHDNYDAQKILKVYEKMYLKLSSN